MKFKRIISLFLVVMMVLSVAPFAISATPAGRTNVLADGTVSLMKADGSVEDFGSGNLTNGEIPTDNKGYLSEKYDSKGDADLFGGAIPAKAPSVAMTVGEETVNYYYVVRTSLPVYSDIDGFAVYAHAYKRTVLDRGFDILVSSDGETWQRVASYTVDLSEFTDAELGADDSKADEIYAKYTAVYGENVVNVKPTEFSSVKENTTAPACVSADFEVVQNVKYVAYACTNYRENNGYYTARISEIEVYGEIDTAYDDEYAGITNEADFLAMKSTGEYHLLNDITLTTTYADTFSGVLDGKGYAIKNSVPVFNKVALSATIKNLVVGDSASPATIVCETEDTVVASLISNVANDTRLIIDNVVNYTNVESVYRLGSLIGVVGDNGSVEITGCKNYGDITGTSAVGGFIGYQRGLTLTIKDCENHGKVSVVEGETAHAAGLVGRFGNDAKYNKDKKFTMTNCVNTGAVTSGARAAGLLGYTLGSKVSINSCINSGNILSTGSGNDVGGLVGCSGASVTIDSVKTSCYTITTISKSYNSGNVTSAGKAGGIVGQNYGSGSNSYVTIDYCTNTGAITGGTYASQFLAYGNSAANVVKYSVAGGTVSGADGCHKSMFSFSSAAFTPATQCVGNYILANDGTTELSYTATADNAASCLALSSDYINIVSQDDLYSGKVAVALNTALGETIFYENVDIIARDAEKYPLDLAPVPFDTHKYVYTLADGKYTNYLAVIEYSQLSLGEGLLLKFFVDFKEDMRDLVPTAKIVVTMNGVETTIEYPYYDAENPDELAMNDVDFWFTEITPQTMGDRIDAVLYINDVEYDRIENYSVLKYAKNLMEITETTDPLYTLLADMLEYGAASQEYRNHNTDALVNEGITGQTEFVELTETDKNYVANTEYTGTSAVTSVGMYFDFDNGLYAKYTTEDFDNFTVNVAYNGFDYTLDHLDWDAFEFEEYAPGQYRVFFAHLWAYDINTVYTVTFEDNGTVVGTLTYSGLSYVYAMQNSSNAELANLVRAYYNYCNSAIAYQAYLETIN